MLLILTLVSWPLTGRHGGSVPTCSRGPVHSPLLVAALLPPNRPRTQAAIDLNRHRRVLLRHCGHRPQVFSSFNVVHNTRERGQLWEGAGPSSTPRSALGSHGSYAIRRHAQALRGRRARRHRRRPIRTPLSSLLRTCALPALELHHHRLLRHPIAAPTTAARPLLPPSWHNGKASRRRGVGADQDQELAEPVRLYELFCLRLVVSFPLATPPTQLHVRPSSRSLSALPSPNESAASLRSVHPFFCSRSSPDAASWCCRSHACRPDGT
jgi:hypothetical protein